MRTGLNGRHHVDYSRSDTHNLTAARAGGALGLRQFELSPAERAGRVEAYRRQINEHGSIVAWLPPPVEPDRRTRRNSGSVGRGRQRRWFDVGTLAGSTYSPAFVPGG